MRTRLTPVKQERPKRVGLILSPDAYQFLQNEAKAQSTTYVKMTMGQVANAAILALAAARAPRKRGRPSKTAQAA